MMPVIVHEEHSPRFALDLEAARDTLESREGSLDEFESNVELLRERADGERVLDVVLSRQVEVELSELDTPRGQREGASFGARLEHLAPHVDPVAEPVCDDPPLDTGKDRPRLRVVTAAYDRPVEGDAVRECDERVVDPVETAVEVHVLRVDIRDDREDGREAHEITVALVRLGDEERTLSQANVLPEALHPAAHHDGRIEPGLLQEGGCQGGCRRLSMCSRHCYPGSHAHQLAEHLGAGDDGQSEPLGLHHLGIIGAHGG